MKIFKYISIFLFALVAYSCQETTMPLFDAKYSFVSVVDGSYSIFKNSKKIMEIPVVIAGIKSADVTVAFTVEESGENPAKEGIDYEIVNVDKKVLISGGAGTGYVQIRVKDNKDAVGDKTFKVKLVSNSANFYIAEDANTVEARVRDSNNPLALLVGDYEQNDYLLSEDKIEGPWIVTIDVVSGSNNMITISNFWDAGKVVNAKVDIANKTIQILAGQIIFVHDSYGDCYAVSINLETEKYDETAPIKGTWTDDGTITIGAWSAMVAAGTFGEYKKSVFVKK